MSRRARDTRSVIQCRAPVKIVAALERHANPLFLNSTRHAEQRSPATKRREIVRR